MMLKQKKEQLRFILHPTDLHKAIVALRESGIEEFQVTELEMIPQSEVVLSGDDLATFEKLVDVLEDDEDVQKVYTNVEGFNLLDLQLELQVFLL